MKLSIIIVNYNVAYFLEHCLNSVRKAIAGIEAEVWVVDNNSVDGSIAMLRQKFPEVKRIENKKNTGFSFANNQAIRKATGKYVVLLNPDTVVEEDTFTKIIAFMDSHPEAGGLGVKMIDGRGKFLPESKRGLPTPVVAFYKIFGLSTLFPASRIFGRYHLGFLDKDKIQSVDVLSGAFMLMPKKVLDEVGLLDETFFMYGEDIDLSYRIIKAGYRNYYFPETRIIHYKGESTKKSSVNYVFVFYKAMIIFARKHFSAQNARTFSLLINLAIYFRAALAIAVRFIKQIALPLGEWLLAYILMLLLVRYWELHVTYIEGGTYPKEFIQRVVPLYTIIWVVSVWLVGGYDRPFQLLKSVKGVFYGTGVILILYAILPDSWRYSRSLILLGALGSMIVSTGLKALLGSLKISGFELSTQNRKRFLIIGKKEEAERVNELLRKTWILPEFVGFLYPDKAEGYDDSFYMGNISQLRDSLEIHHINEIIFCARDIASHVMIDIMLEMSQTQVDYKIAPPESLFMVGSNDINTAGDLYTIEMNSISSAGNKRNKRMLDLLICVMMAPLFPFVLLVVNRRMGFVNNWFKVLAGVKSWVGYAGSSDDYADPVRPLPLIRKGVLNPSDRYQGENDLKKLNLLYSKDYSALNDLHIIRFGFRELGRG